MVNIENILKYAKSEIDNKASLQPQLDREFHNEKARIATAGTRLLEVYLSDIKSLRERTIARLNEEHETRKTQYSNYTIPQKEPDKHFLNTGFLEPKVHINLSYSGVKTKWYDYFWDIPKKVSLNIEMSVDDEKRSVFPLEFNYSGKRLRDYSPDKVAHYLRQVVNTALDWDIKLTAKEHNVAEINEAFEGNLVLTVADFFRDPNILVEYRKLL